MKRGTMWAIVLTCSVAVGVVLMFFGPTIPGPYASFVARTCLFVVPIEYQNIEVIRPVLRFICFLTGFLPVLLIGTIFIALTGRSRQPEDPDQKENLR